MATLPSTQAFQHRQFRTYQSARVLWIIATQMQAVAVGWQVYSLTGKALDLGLVGLARFLPFFALSLVGGHAADRFDRRAILLVCYALESLGMAALFFLARTPAPGILPIYAVMVLFGCTRAFSSPASSALLPHLVPPEHFENAVVWGSALRPVASVVGPAVGGLLYAAADASAAYAACLAATLAALLLLLSLKTRTGRMEARDVSWETVSAGLRFVWRSKLLLGTFSMDLFAVLLGGATALLPIFARDILHVGPAGLGLLRAAPALGAGTMAVFLAFHPLTRHAGKIMLAAVALFGLATVAFGLSTHFGLSALALVLMGATDTVSVVVRLTLEQIATPSEMRGRVGAVNMMFIGASNELGEFESGATAAWLGPVAAVVVGGVGTCMVVALWAMLFPSLRKLNRLGDARS